jgi:hypothetical protein
VQLVLGEGGVGVVEAFEEEAEVPGKFGLHYLNDIDEFDLFFDDNFAHRIVL